MEHHDIILSSFYEYGLIVWCCVSAHEEINALFNEAVSDSLMEVETHNLRVFKKLGSHCSIIDLDEECFSDGGSFETPQKVITFKKQIQKAVVNVL